MRLQHRKKTSFSTWQPALNQQRLKLFLNEEATRKYSFQFDAFAVLSLNSMHNTFYASTPTVQCVLPNGLILILFVFFFILIRRTDRKVTSVFLCVLH